jgi:hypothetical protein
MAKKSKSESAPILIRLEFIPMFDDLTDEETGKVMKAIFDYRLYGAIPEFGDRMLNIPFNALKRMMDDDFDAYKEKCKKNAENAKKRALEEAKRALAEEESTKCNSDVADNGEYDDDEDLPF